MRSQESGFSGLGQREGGAVGWWLSRCSALCGRGARIQQQFTKAREFVSTDAAQDVLCGQALQPIFWREALKSRFGWDAVEPHFHGHAREEVLCRALGVFEEFFLSGDVGGHLLELPLEYFVV